jgi:hypothetical protein
LGNIIPFGNTGIDKTTLTAIIQNLFVAKAYKGNAFGFIVIHRGIPVA